MLVQECSFQRIGCAKSGSFADFCSEVMSLVWQGSKSLYRHKKNVRGSVSTVLGHLCRRRATAALPACSIIIMIIINSSSSSSSSSILSRWNKMVNQKTKFPKQQELCLTSSSELESRKQMQTQHSAMQAENRLLASNLCNINSSAYV